jgi:hypothetical protein
MDYTPAARRKQATGSSVLHFIVSTVGACASTATEQECTSYHASSSSS